MNTRYLSVTALCLILSAAGSAAAQDATPFAPVVAQERAVLDAVVKNDTAAFNRALGSDFVYVDVRGPVRWELAKTTAMIVDCKTTQLSIDNPQTTRVGKDLVVLTYMSSGDQVCGGQKAPSPVYSMSVWQMRGGRWVGVRTARHRPRRSSRRSAPRRSRQRSHADLVTKSA